MILKSNNSQTNIRNSVKICVKSEKEQFLVFHTILEFFQCKKRKILDQL